MKGATVRDVAKEAGVSVGTVSRYLNGQILKVRNMIAVQEAIEKLGFKENMIAKGLKNHMTMSVGVVINTLTDVFATAVLTSLESFLEENNYSLIICDYQRDQKKLDKKLRFLKSRSVDALVLFYVQENLPILDEFRNEGIPVLSMDSPTKNAANDALVVNNDEASYLMMQHIYELGHRDIAIISGSQDHYTGKERFNGCVRFFKDKDLTMDFKYIYFGDDQKEDGYIAMNKFIENGNVPSVVYATNYYMTMGAMQSIYEHGLSIPEDVSLVGFDYTDVYDVFPCKITVMEQPVDDMGREAGKIILKRIKKGLQNKNPQVLQLDTKLRIGNSIKKMKKN